MSSRDDRNLETRLTAAKQYFREHHAEIEPDPGFAGRVAVRLHRPAEEMLAWAAIKMLPATVALVFVMAWIAFQAEPAGDTTVAVTAEQTTEDLLGWVLEESEATP